MDTMKKIYTFVIGLTVITFLVLFLIMFDIISVNSETGSIISTLSLVMIFPIIMLSRASNIYGNRRALYLAYASSFGALMFMIIGIALVLCISTGSNNLNTLSTITSILSFIAKVDIILFLLVLIYEVPIANSSHAKFQHIVAICTVVAFLTALIAFKSSSLSGLISSPYTSSAYSVLDDGSSSSTLKGISSVATLLSFAGMLINPMLRTYYIDRDHYALEEDRETELLREKVEEIDSKYKNGIIVGEQKSQQPVVPNVEDPPQNPGGVPETTPIEVNDPTVEKVEESSVLHQEPVKNEQYQEVDENSIGIPTVDTNEQK